jgi:hypothetical protein
VELTALEEQISLSKDWVARLREKAMKRKDYGAAYQIDQFQREIDVAHRRIESLK